MNNLFNGMNTKFMDNFIINNKENPFSIYLLLNNKYLQTIEKKLIFLSYLHHVVVLPKPLG